MSSDMEMVVILPTECENECGRTVPAGGVMHIFSAVDMRWVCPICYWKQYREDWIIARTKAIEATMPDEFPATYARYCAEQQYVEQIENVK